MNRPQWVLGDSLLQMAAQLPGGTAVLADGQAHTYEEFADASLRLARGLQDLGVARGDRVVIQLENSWHCAVSIFGASLAGTVFVVVNPQTKPDRLAYILGDSGASVLIAENQALSALDETEYELPALRHKLSDGGPTAGAVRLNHVIERSETAPRAGPPIPVDLAALIYTSGTTGEPKGVMMTHSSMVFAVESVARYLRLGDGERILNVLPLAFSYGLHQLTLAVRTGSTLVLERSFAFPANTVNQMREHEVTVVPGVPTIFGTLLGMRDIAPIVSVRRVTNAGAAIPRQYVDGVHALFPNALVFLMYGQTECKRISYLEPELAREKPLSVGKAMPGTEAYVLRADGRRASPGEVGILHVRGSHVMVGYWGKPDLTNEKLQKGTHSGDCVLRTDDFFRQDADGYLYFVGRTDDMINTRGEKVSPLELENVLLSIPAVREAIAVGVPDELLGEAVRAVLVLKDGERLTEQEVKRFCRTRVESALVPKEVRFVDELPKTAAGKIQRSALDAPTA